MMQSINYSKIILSLGLIVFVAAMVVAGTGAFFSDTETSTGNVFTAGALDLKIDSVQHYNGMVCAETAPDSGTYVWVPESGADLDPDNHAVVNGTMDEQTEIDAFNDANPAQYPQAGETCTGSWRLADDSGQPVIGQFWDFADIKPGDQGENTISLHIENNDAWMCASLANVSEADNGQTEPEALVDLDGDAAGELDENLFFFGWLDDGDNIYEPNDGEVSFGDPVAASELVDGTWALADASTGNGPVAGGETNYIGVYWCAGTIDTNAGAGPLTCDGASMGNEAQTDSWMTDLSFYIEQSRNNPDFLCEVPDEPEPREDVGVALGDYEGPDPQVCNATVADGESIQTEIDGASAGQTICVEDGVHDTDTYPLRVNEDNLTLVALNGPTNTAELTGGVIIDNPGVTLRGFHINGESTLLSETFGVYVNGGADNVTIVDNVIEGNDTNPSRGIVTAIGAVDNLLVTNNEIKDWFTGIFQNESSNTVVSYNTITSNAVGSANDGPDGNSIHHNVIADNTAEGVGVSDFGAAVNSLSVNFNNIEGNPAENQMNNYDLEAVDGGFEVDAEDNWWGDATPVDNLNGSGNAPIDFDPFEISAFPLN